MINLIGWHKNKDGKIRLMQEKEQSDWMRSKSDCPQRKFIMDSLNTITCTNVSGCSCGYQIQLCRFPFHPSRWGDSETSHWEAPQTSQSMKIWREFREELVLLTVFFLFVFCFLLHSRSFHFTGLSFHFNSKCPSLLQSFVRCLFYCKGNIFYKLWFLFSLLGLLNLFYIIFNQRKWQLAYKWYSLKKIRVCCLWSIVAGRYMFLSS